MPYSRNQKEHISNIITALKPNTVKQRDLFSLVRRYSHLLILILYMWPHPIMESCPNFLKSDQRRHTLTFTLYRCLTPTLVKTGTAALTLLASCLEG